MQIFYQRYTPFGIGKDRNFGFPCKTLSTFEESIFSVSPLSYTAIESVIEIFTDILRNITRRGQTTPQMFRQFLGISHYFALLEKY